jgi:hypothetical protein
MVLSLKGVGTSKYLLGGDFYRNLDGTLAWGAHSYVSKMLNNYETIVEIHAPYTFVLQYLNLHESHQVRENNNQNSQ